MKGVKLFVPVLFLVLGTVSVPAQMIRVSGHVTDASTGEGVPFAYVQIKEAEVQEVSLGAPVRGTSTDVNGFYVLDAPTDAVLIFTSVGYVTQQVQVMPYVSNGAARGTAGAAAVIDVEMHQETVALDDVLVVAYGTAKKESFTGSAEVIRADKLEKRTVANVTKALDGMSTGVITNSGSGQPGSGASVVIRGFGSLNASNNPLYVVDGVPYDGNISAINPNDIESMTIIKDASAGALYGARGANGVVIINTRKGKEGAMSVQFKGNWSIASRAIPRYETMDAYAWTEDAYMMYLIEGRRNGYQGEDIALYAIDRMLNSPEKLFGPDQMYNPFSRPIEELFDTSTGKIKKGTTLRWNEDWLDESTAKNPLRQEYLMNLSGGSEKTKYMFSLGWLDQDGLVKATNFRRYSARANIDAQVNEWFKTGLNANFANSRSNSTTLGSDATSSTAFSNVFYSCATMGPIYPVYEKDASGKTVYDENGDAKYDWGDYRPDGSTPGWNPVANLYADRYLDVDDNLSARTYVDLGGLESGPLQGLKFSVNFGFDYINAKTTTYYNPEFGNASSIRGYLYQEAERTFSCTFNQLLSYNRSFGRHNVDFLAGHEFYDYNYQTLSAGKTGSAGDNIYELEGFVTNDGIGGYSEDYCVDSWLTRLNYGYDNRYYFSASYRRDASSRFHKDNRWGDFWSLGASWRISEEEFMQDLPWLNNLTVKASYGVQGNDAIGSYYAWQQLYSLAYPNGGLGGAVISKLETKDLKWEKNGNFNVGVEGRLFNRLSATIEWYRRKTDDMLMDYPMAVSLGFSGYNKNIGSMLNSGIEISLSGNVIEKGDFLWNASVMASTVRNRVLKLTESGTPIKSGNYIIQEGKEVNSFYLATSAGVDPATGDKLYWAWDVDEESGEREAYVTASPSVASANRHVCGSRIPDLYGSISNELRFRDFDFNLLCTFSIGGKVLDGAYFQHLYSTYAGTAAHVDRKNAWKEPGDMTSIPRIDLGGSSNIIYTSDNLVSASYFTIKSFTLGYTLPSKWANAASMKSVRCTLSGDNLCMFSARKGLDPQYNFTGSTGYTYIPERTVSFGVEINF